MGIKFLCPNGHKMNVKSFLAGKKGICPKCGTKVDIPLTGDDGKADGVDLEPPGSLLPAPATGATATAKPIAAPTFAVVVNQPTTMPATVAGTVPVPSAAVPQGYPAGINYGTVVSPLNQETVAYPATASYGTGTVPTTLQPAPLQPAAPRDAIAEAPQASWHVRPPSGGQFGPARGEVMREWLTQGRVTADSLVWREGWNDWQKADAVFPNLRASAGSGPAPTQAAKEEPMEAMVRAPSSGLHRVLPRRKSKDAIMLFSVLLFIVIALLALVLGYVLMKNNKKRSEPVQTEIVPVMYQAGSGTRESSDATGG